MPKRSNDKLRVLIAVTEFSPVDALWNAALQRIEETPGDVLALFVTEDHWYRAARLPVTLEISRLSGAGAKFTLQRAEQVRRDAIRRVQDLMTRLASESNLALAFEVLAESDHARLLDLVADSRIVLIAPSGIARQTVYAELKKLNCRIELVGLLDESGEQERGNDSRQPD